MPHCTPTQHNFLLWIKCPSRTLKVVVMSLRYERFKSIWVLSYQSIFYLLITSNLPLEGIILEKESLSVPHWGHRR
jgi:hypothetical protein